MKTSKCCIIDLNFNFDCLLSGITHDDLFVLVMSVTKTSPITRRYLLLCSIISQI